VGPSHPRDPLSHGAHSPQEPSLPGNSVTQFTRGLALTHVTQSPKGPGAWHSPMCPGSLARKWDAPTSGCSPMSVSGIANSCQGRGSAQGRRKGGEHRGREKGESTGGGASRQGARQCVTRYRTVPYERLGHRKQLPGQGKEGKKKWGEHRGRSTSRQGVSGIANSCQGRAKEGREMLSARAGGRKGRNT